MSTKRNRNKRAIKFGIKNVGTDTFQQNGILLNNNIESSLKTSKSTPNGNNSHSFNINLSDNETIKNKKSTKNIKSRVSKSPNSRVKNRKNNKNNNNNKYGCGKYMNSSLNDCYSFLSKLEGSVVKLHDITDDIQNIMLHIKDNGYERINILY